MIGVRLMIRVLKRIKQKIISFFESDEETMYDIELMKLKREYDNRSWKNNAWKVKSVYKRGKW